MNILAIETTGAEASVAIIDGRGKLTEAISHENLNHLSFLMPLVGEALEKAGLNMSDIDAVAASEGPGSFTGIRIGVSSARALSQALDLPCVSVPTLKAFLYNLDEKEDFFKEREDADKTVFCPIFDARRSQVYGGAYAWTRDETAADTTDNIWEVVEGKAYALSDLLDELAQAVKTKKESKDKEGACKKAYNKIVFFGDGVDKYSTDVEKWSQDNFDAQSEVTVEFAAKEKRYQQAVSVAKLAIELYKKEQTCHYNELKPNYMRKAEAERKLEEAKAVAQTEATASAEAKARG